MPRIAKGETARGIYHSINRGNIQMQIFDDEEDYVYFLELIKSAKSERMWRSMLTA